ncbi:hypothetical protein F5I97DRAFT_635368 [Phlebopus sp. FC_14]|nr:hypothetical protein F5I97DRAFT_635368 [Phlebopus sp. FC_14]
MTLECKMEGKMEYLSSGSPPPYASLPPPYSFSCKMSSMQLPNLLKLLQSPEKYSVVQWHTFLRAALRQTRICPRVIRICHLKEHKDGKKAHEFLALTIQLSDESHTTVADLIIDRNPSDRHPIRVLMSKSHACDTVTVVPRTTAASASASTPPPTSHFENTYLLYNLTWTTFNRAPLLECYWHARLVYVVASSIYPDHQAQSHAQSRHLSLRIGNYLGGDIGEFTRWGGALRDIADSEAASDNQLVSSV